MWRWLEMFVKVDCHLLCDQQVHSLKPGVLVPNNINAVAMVSAPKVPCR